MSESYKFIFLKNLISNSKFIESAPEEAVVRYELMKESWRIALPEEKQTKRKQFLASGKKIKSVINLTYYENVILIYTMIIQMLDKLSDLNISNEVLTNEIDLQLYRIKALLIIEQGHIDENIVPIHHLPPIYFQNIANELNSTYPDLNLKEFAEKYTEMFESWPEKSKYDIKKS